MLGWQEVLQLKRPWKVEQTKDGCLGSRLKAAPCGRCVEICPHQAIAVQGGRVQREETKCNDCGLCMRVCPEQVFTSWYVVEGMQEQFEQGVLLGETSLVFTCQEDPSVPADLTTFNGRVLGCLGSLHTEQLVTWALGGINQIYINTNHCEGCKMNGLPLVREAVRHAKSVLRSLGWQGNLVWGEPTVASNWEETRQKQHEVVDRREFMNSIKAEVGKGLLSFVESTTKSMIKFELPKEIKQETGATKVVSTKGVLPYRGPFIEALKNRKIQALQGTGEASLWRGLRRQKECSKCKICTVFCWSGAIQRKESAGKVELYFDGSNCNNCRYCVLACPEGALIPADLWNFSEKQLL